MFFIFQNSPRRYNSKHCIFKFQQRIRYSSTNISSSDFEKTEHENDDPIDEPGEPRMKKTKLVDTNVSNTADASKISSRKLMKVFSQLPNIKVEKLIISTSTIKRDRKKYCKENYQREKDSFKKDCASATLTVHWDSKKLPALSGKGNVNRTSVVVSSTQIMKLLGVPISLSGCGNDEVQSVFNTLQDWELIDNIKGMCFDTTASNSGIHKGACTMLEKRLDRRLYCFACRHHILELIVAAEYDNLFGKSESPQIDFFERFSKHWASIDPGNYCTGMVDPFLEVFLAAIKNEIVNFVRKQITEYQPREDYFELLNLVLILFGEKQIKVA